MSNIRRITERLDKVASEIESENPALALAIDKISDRLEGRKLAGEFAMGEMSKVKVQELHTKETFNGIAIAHINMPPKSSDIIVRDLNRKVSLVEKFHENSMKVMYDEKWVTPEEADKKDWWEFDLYERSRDDIRRDAEFGKLYTKPNLTIGQWFNDSLSVNISKI